MKKRLLAVLLAGAMVMSLAACGGSKEEAPAADAGSAATESAAPAGDLAWNADDVQGSVEAALAATDGKVAIITNTLSQNEEEYRSAEAMVEKYGDRIIHDTMPDNFMTEQEQFVSVVSKVCSDTNVKAVIINQACPGSDASIDKVLETRDADDILVVFATPQENADDIVQRADIVVSIDEINKGGAMAQQAYDMGCKTFVHYSFPRHMAQAPLSGCRSQIEEKCKELGMEFVDATAPDPTSDAGVSGAQMFILEDVPKMVEKYGQETAFFATNCAMQVPLIEAVAKAGAYYPMPCCPSPYHGFPSAFGIESPEDLVNGLQTTIDAIQATITDRGLDGHFSTWAVPASIANTVASTEYAFLWMAGLVPDCDADIMATLIGDYCGTDVEILPYEDPETGNSFDNYLVYQQGYLTFGELAGPADAE